MGQIADVLSKNIVRLRDERGWTQEQLSEFSSVGVGTIRNLEGKKSWVGLSTVEALSRAFNVEESELFVDPSRVSRPSIRDAFSVLMAEFRRLDRTFEIPDIPPSKKHIPKSPSEDEL